MHRIALAKVDGAAIGGREVHLLVSQRGSQMAFIIGSVAKILVEHQSDLQMMSHVIVGFRFGAERISVIRGRPSLQPGVDRSAVWQRAQQVETPQEGFQACFVDRLAGWLVYSSPGVDNS